jgi:hypothetical protein
MFRWRSSETVAADYKMNLVVDMSHERLHLAADPSTIFPPNDSDSYSTWQDLIKLLMAHVEPWVVLFTTFTNRINITNDDRPDAQMQRCNKSRIDYTTRNCHLDKFALVTTDTTNRKYLQRTHEVYSCVSKPHSPIFVSSTSAPADSETVVPAVLNHGSNADGSSSSKDLHRRRGRFLLLSI